MTQESEIDRSLKIIIKNRKNDIKLFGIFEGFSRTNFPRNFKIRLQSLTARVSSNFEGIKIWKSKMSQFDQ